MATTSSDLKNTYIKNLKEAANTIAAGTMELIRRTGSARGIGAARLAEIRVAVMEKEIEVLWKEQTGKAACGRQDSARCNASTSELGLPRRMMGGGGRRSVSPSSRKNLRSSGLP